MSTPLASEIVFLIRSYNESTRILSTIEGILSAGYTQILVIDDGSSDETTVILDQADLPESIHRLRHPINRGGGAAMETGFEFIRRFSTRF